MTSDDLPPESRKRKRPRSWAERREDFLDGTPSSFDPSAPVKKTKVISAEDFNSSNPPKTYSREHSGPVGTRAKPVAAFSTEKSEREPYRPQRRGRFGGGGYGGPRGDSNRRSGKRGRGRSNPHDRQVGDDPVDVAATTKTQSGESSNRWRHAGPDSETSPARDSDRGAWKFSGTANGEVSQNSTENSNAAAEAAAMIAQARARSRYGRGPSEPMDPSRPVFDQNTERDARSSRYGLRGDSGHDSDLGSRRNSQGHSRKSSLADLDEDSGGVSGLVSGGEFGSASEPATNALLEGRRPKRKARDKVMDILARRPHSRLEIEQKMSPYYSMQEIVAAIQFAEENNWMMPPEEMAFRLSLELGRRKKGHRYIAQYLKKRGLPAVETDRDAEVEKALELIASKAERFGRASEKSAARTLAKASLKAEKLAAKTAASNAGGKGASGGFRTRSASSTEFEAKRAAYAERSKYIQKLQAALASRGFDGDTISRALRIWQDEQK